MLDLTEGGAPVAIEVTGLGIGLNQVLECMKKFGRVALLGCTRSSDFSVNYYSKVHAPGISLIGAHTRARPKVESYPGYWTDRDEIQGLLKLVYTKRLDYSDMVCEVHSPSEAPQVFTRLVTEKNFPIGVLFDWSLIKSIGERK